NIANGDAMAVYTGGSGIEGFIMILENNARIDIMMLGLGLFFSFGAIWVLVRNGIMVGVFQYFFVQHGGFQDSLLTIWLHGTIEISTIGLMGGVALLAGKGLLFPGNYTRYQSWRLSAGNAGKLLLMVLPFTLIAAIIEGFVTRMTGMPDIFKGLFILLNLVLVVMYFFVYPAMVHRKIGANPHHEKLRKDHPPKPISKKEIKTTSQIITDTFVTYKNQFGRNIALCLTAGIIYPILLYLNFDRYFLFHSTPAMDWLKNIFDTIFQSDGMNNRGIPETGDYRLFKGLYFGIWTLILLLVNAVYAFKFKLSLKYFSQYLLVFGVVLLSSFFRFYVHTEFPVEYLTSFAYLLSIGLAVTVLLVTHYYSGKTQDIVKLFFGKVFHFFIVWLAVSVLLFFVQMMAHSGLSELSIFILNDLLPFDAMTKEKIAIGTQICLYMTVVMATIPFYIYATYYMVLSLVEKYEAIHLKEEVEAIVAEA
ncbi:MAG: putative membrane protein SpoIIM required for sporulation, partial [Bacteroidia bacterium]